MENGGAELSAVPSPFWALLALLRREPGMGWLPRGPGGYRGSWRPSGLETISEEETADEVVQIAERNPLGPQPLKALLLLEDSGDNHLWQMYYEGLKNFLAFRGGMAWSAVWPIPVDQVIEFLITMDFQNMPPTKMITYVEGLSFISKMANHPDPLHDPVIQHMISTLKERVEPENEGHAPVTIEVLRSLLGTLESVCSSPYECMLFRAMFTAGFFGALRIEEMVAHRRNAAQPELLYLSDLHFTEVSANLRVHAAHRDQESHLIKLGLCREMWICPVEALRSYVAARPPGEGPLFVLMDGRAVTKRHFLTVFHRALGILGLPPKKYGVHSFWLGAVATAVFDGVSNEALSRAASWW